MTGAGTPARHASRLHAARDTEGGPMRQPRALAPLVLAGLLLTAACGESGSSGTGGADAASGSSASGQACAPVAGDQLVRLDDDKNLQTVDNIIPAVSAQAAAASRRLIGPPSRPYGSGPGGSGRAARALRSQCRP